MTLAEKFQILRSGYLIWMKENADKVIWSVPKPYKLPEGYKGHGGKK